MNRTELLQKIDAAKTISDIEKVCGELHDWSFFEDNLDSAKESADAALDQIRDGEYLEALHEFEITGDAEAPFPDEDALATAEAHHATGEFSDEEAAAVAALTQLVESYTEDDGWLHHNGWNVDYVPNADAQYVKDGKEFLKEQLEKGEFDSMLD